MYWGKAGPEAQTSNGMVRGHISLRFLSPVWQDILTITLYEGCLHKWIREALQAFFEATLPW